MRACPNCQRTYTDDIGFCPQDGTPLPPPPVAQQDTLAEGLSRRYRIVRRLGSGGMGSVFLAEQIAVGNRLVALKVLLRKLLDDPEFLMRFTNEAASTGRIHHTNVVTVYESGQADDGSPYIAMEYLEGETLRQALKERGAMSIEEVMEILQQVARGLNAAHKLGTIHRDLKPDNIFLTKDDEGHLVVKVVDFGIAKLLESSSITITGTVLGTPAYMSFEQASGMKSEDLDARSDIYSLGVVVYEMLMGRVPFDSETPMGYVRKHLIEEPPPFRSVQPDLPVSPELEKVVLKSLAKERDQRYSSALEFARAFADAAKSSDTAELPVGRTVVVSRPLTPVPMPPERPAPVDSSQRRTPRVKPGSIPVKGTEPEVHPIQVKSELSRGAQASRPAGQTPDRARPPVGSVEKTEPPKPVVPQQTRPPATAQPQPTSQTLPIVLAIVFALLLVGGAVWYYTRPSPVQPHQDGDHKVEPNGPPAGMVQIAGGTFMMGRDNAKDAEETPAHSVTVAAFYLAKVPVTNAAYLEFVRATQHEPPSGEIGGVADDWPVVRVSWDDAQAYCQWKGMRLPTEVEWEFVAKGSDGRRYPWGDTFVSAYVNSKEAELNHPQPVGSHRDAGSPAGVYDMAGNAWQWVQDEYQPYPGHQSPFQIPSDAKVIRGGSFRSDKDHVTTTTRNLDHSSSKSPIIGFRCAKSM